MLLICVHYDMKKRLSSFRIDKRLQSIRIKITWFHVFHSTCIFYVAIKTTNTYTNGFRKVSCRWKLLLKTCWRHLFLSVKIVIALFRHIKTIALNHQNTVQFDWHTMTLLEIEYEILKIALSFTWPAASWHWWMVWYTWDTQLWDSVPYHFHIQHKWFVCGSHI